MHDDVALERLQEEPDEEERSGARPDRSSTDGGGGVLPVPGSGGAPSANGHSGDIDAAFRELIRRAQAGDASAASRLYELLYQDMRGLAARWMRGQAAGHLLQTTALVSEAYLKVGRVQRDWNDRAHALAVLSTAMRQVLVDHARSTQNGKRKPPGTRAPIEDVIDSYAANAINLVEFHDLIERIRQVSTRTADVIVLRIEQGYTFEEIGRILGVSASTAERHWEGAQRWLR